MYADESLQKHPFALPTTTTIPFPTTRFRSLPRRVLDFLTPSFLSKNAPASIDRPTDFLDGMRGYASFIVFISHMVSPIYPNYAVGFGSQGGKNDHWVPQLPIIRLMSSGLAMVHLFFVLSGFSISLKPLKLMRQGNFNLLFDTLVSATFRRAARLYLPCLALLVGILAMVCMGFFNDAFDMATKENWPFDTEPLTPPPVYETYGAQLKSFWHCWWQWSDPVSKSPIPKQRSLRLSASFETRK